MAEETKKDQEVVISEEALREAAKYIEEEEGPPKGSRAGSTRSLRGSPWHRPFFHLYAAVGIVITQVLRGIHVAIILFLTFSFFLP